MKQNSKRYFPLLLGVVASIVVAKVLATLVYVFLPKYPTIQKEKISVRPSYTRITLQKFFYSAKTKTPQQTPQSMANLNSFILKALYGDKNSGFVIIALKNNPQKTTIIGVGEVYQGYKLEAIGLGYALFTKGGKEYKLEVKKDKKLSQKFQDLDTSSTDIQESTPSVVTVQKTQIKHFASHPDKIWKNIGIVEYKEGGELRGFRVKWIKKGSIFEKLGLQKGDIIMAVNNKQLRSYKDAISIYQQINSLQTLSLLIQRDGEEKEIVYEIH